MKLGRRKKRYRPNIFAMVVMAVITILLVCAMSYHTSDLEQRVESYEARIASLNLQIAEASENTKELEEQRVYMQSSQYIMEMAKNVLGLVEPGEIVVMPQQ